MASNEGLFRKDPVQGLVDYVLDIKPFHTKIVDVLIEYIYTDPLNVKITDELQIHIDMDINRTAVYSDGGFDTYSWGLMDDGSDPWVELGNPSSGYQEFSDGMTAGLPDGTEINATSWDWAAAYTRAGQTTILVTMEDSISFTDGNEIRLSDTLKAYFDDDDRRNIGWDSGIRSRNLVGIDYVNDVVIIEGKHVEVMNGVVLDGQGGRPYSIGFPGHQIALYDTMNNDGLHVVVSSVYNSIENRTYLQVTPSINKPMTVPLNNIFGRLADVESIYFDPRIGYEGPVPYDPNKPPVGREGWDASSWDVPAHRIGNRISESYRFNVFNHPDDRMIADMDLPFNDGDIVYIDSYGSLPIVEVYGTLTQLERYTPYYFYRSDVEPNRRFSLALKKDGPYINIVSNSDNDCFIGIGKKVMFMEVVIGHQDDALADIPDSIVASNEIILTPSFTEIIRVDTGKFVVLGDRTSDYRSGTALTVNGSFNGMNDGKWETSGSYYDVDADETQINVLGPSPTDTYPLGTLVAVGVGRDETRAETSFVETLAFHVNSIVFTDTIGVYFEEDRTTLTSRGIPSMVNSFDLGFFGIGGFGGDFL